MKKIKVILGTVVLVSLLGFSSFAAITTTPKGVQKLDSADIVDALNNNADILDNHIDKIATSDILGHVKIANDLETDDPEAALSAAMGKELNDKITSIGGIQIEQMFFASTESITVAAGGYGNVSIDLTDYGFTKAPIVIPIESGWLQLHRQTVTETEYKATLLNYSSKSRNESLQVLILGMK